MEIAIPTQVMQDYFEKFQEGILREFAAAVSSWGESASALARWEDENLLDNPSQELLAAHQNAVERLVSFGRFLSLTAEHPNFPDANLKQNVSATLRTLRDKISLWHGKMGKDRSESILAEAFPK